MSTATAIWPSRATDLSWLWIFNCEMSNVIMFDVHPLAHQHLPIIVQHVDVHSRLGLASLAISRHTGRISVTPEELAVETSISLSLRSSDYNPYINMDVVIKPQLWMSGSPPRHRELEFFSKTSYTTQFSPTTQFSLGRELAQETFHKWSFLTRLQTTVGNLALTSGCLFIIS